MIMGLPTIQLETLSVVSSVAMTAMSTIVAIVALVFSYRQNAGWQPIALIVGQSMSGVGGIGMNEFEVHIEFWNRRKYPVAIRAIIANVSGFSLKSNGSSARNEPYIRDNRLVQKVATSVNPSDQFGIKLPFRFEPESMDAMRPVFDIEVIYFDPHVGKERKAKLHHRAFYPELGWKRTEEEREKAQQLFRELNRPRPDTV